MTDNPRILKKNTGGAVTPIGGGLTVGRSEDCGLRLTEGSPSRQHARLIVEGDQLWVEDLGSTNGSFVNGVRIAARTLLKNGDALRFDIEEYTYSTGVADVDKTVLRQPATPAPPLVVAATPTPAQQLPPGWTEGAGQAAGANKTVFQSPQELAEKRRGAPALVAAAAPATSDVPVLCVSSGAAPAKRLELKATGSDKQEWSIGSDAVRELCLPVSGVSALHARIVRDGERWKIIDQVSANGTYVNGKRCTMSFLNSGDRIAFGPVECSFVLPDRALPPGEVPPGAEAAPGRGGWTAGRIAIIGAVSFLLTLVVVYLLMR
ncbi:MAG TPA: FHA domain-containing protein [Steroidobacteraceae bacterium]|nr:FHA domain-containing protein [Steroidobacteraceae bacterium]